MTVDVRKKEMTDTGQRIEEETADDTSRADSDPDSWSESEHDDSVLDEDYRPKKDDRPDDDSDADTAQHSEEEAALEAPAVKSHKRPRSHMWKRQVIKEKRLKEESYKNATGQERQPKTMGPPCTSQHCLMSEKRSCELLSEEERTDIFNNFWSMPSWETRKLYIQTLVENVPIKQKKEKNVPIIPPATGI
ncbi:hypothetical protein JOQ06_029780 [Pogonophryne albipinna]|uniref:Uncharacterized protein n=1 Tax=Pogonophryne albipinna TaxID=1090488 RepID=A0AAD6AXS4_9TELE|nr:hypothetical protein JOQ06_029780 [Pogonophryne albipinna]